MNEDEAVAMGYIGAIEIKLPVDGEPVQAVYPFGDRPFNEQLEKWATARFERFWEHGPGLDGWAVFDAPEFDGKIFQIMMREVVLPDLGPDT